MSTYWIELFDITGKPTAFAEKHYADGALHVYTYGSYEPEFMGCCMVPEEALDLSGATDYTEHLDVA